MRIDYVIMLKHYDDFYTMPDNILRRSVLRCIGTWNFFNKSSIFNS